eukprot:m.86546 g.86546  ORF g.86546 m.86546 type:complete len:719 (-) comp14880_c0_seq3:128-2284(-)
MGLLTVATPLHWDDSREHLEFVRRHGIEQFIAVYNRMKYISGDRLMYGDEIEYGLIKLDPAVSKARILLKGPEVADKLSECERQDGQSRDDTGGHWHPEYGAWMLEGTPGQAYGGFTSDLRRVEINMRSRRSRILTALSENEIAPTLVSFPQLGVGDFAIDGAGNTDFTPNGPKAASRYIPDEIIHPHPRFAALTQNIRLRRQRNVKMMVPLYEDRNTDLTPEEGSDGDPGIYMDAMAFGMGSCCLQVTFQARDVSESRHLYDQLAVLAPIMLALTAATPIFKGKLADIDVRWNVIAGSVDCRTAAEDGSGTTEPQEQLAGKGVRPLAKSRYSSIDMFICNHLAGEDPHTKTATYNDVPVVYDQEFFDRLVAEEDIDPILAKHVAHLFVRDPLVIFKERIELDDSVDTDHFENLQSTNWNTVRWKPPPSIDEHSDRKIGWRTEFRSMEVQLTDYENAAFTVFITLVSRVLLSFDLNLYIPISKLDENMERAHKRDAVLKETFWFRAHLAPPGEGECCVEGDADCPIHSDDDQVVQMSILEVLTGKGKFFPGIVPLVFVYLEKIGCDQETQDKVQAYMKLIISRASGETKTAAKWMRDFVVNHPDYKHDSIVSDKIAYDLVTVSNDIGLGKRAVPDLLGNIKIEPVLKENAYNVQLTRLAHSRAELRDMMARYAARAEISKRKREIRHRMGELRQELEELQTELDELEDRQPASHEPAY